MVGGLMEYNLGFSLAFWVPGNVGRGQEIRLLCRFDDYTLGLGVLSVRRAYKEQSMGSGFSSSSNACSI